MFLGGKSDLYRVQGETEKHCLSRDAIQHSGCRVAESLLNGPTIMKQPGER